MRDLLKDILDFLHSIQGSPRASIGSISNTYVPQLRVDRIDKLAACVSMALHSIDGDSMEIMLVCKDDLQLILMGLDEYWVMLPEHKPAIERLQRALEMAQLRMEV